QLPVAVDVAIPVEAAAKAGARELAGVEVDIGLGDPRRQRRRRLASREEPAVARNHADAARARRQGTRTRIARTLVEHSANRLARIALELGLGHARLLEIELVEDRVVR